MDLTVDQLLKFSSGREAKRTRQQWMVAWPGPAPGRETQHRHAEYGDSERGASLSHPRHLNYKTIIV